MLTRRDTGLVKQYNNTFDKEAPFSHTSRSITTMGICASVDGEVSKAFLS
jgi:hypothetical protein